MGSWLEVQRTEVNTIVVIESTSDVKDLFFEEKKILPYRLGFLDQINIVDCRNEHYPIQYLG